MKKGMIYMKKGMISSVIISVISVVNLWAFLFQLLPLDAQVQEMMDIYQRPEDAEYGVLLFTGLAAASVMVVAYIWLSYIAVIHMVCLIFTIKNRKVEDKKIRIYNYILDAVNVFLILGPLVKLLVYLK